MVLTARQGPDIDDWWRPNVSALVFAPSYPLPAGRHEIENPILKAGQIAVRCPEDLEVARPSTKKQVSATISWFKYLPLLS